MKCDKLGGSMVDNIDSEEFQYPINMLLAMDLYDAIGPYAFFMSGYDIAFEVSIALLTVCTTAGIEKEKVRDILQAALTVYARHDGDIEDIEMAMRKKFDIN